MWTFRHIWHKQLKIFFSFSPILSLTPLNDALSFLWGVLDFAGTVGFRVIFSLHVIYSWATKLQFLVLSFEQSLDTFFFYLSMALSNLTLIGQQKSQVMKDSCPLPASAPRLLPFPVAKTFQRTTKRKEETKEKITHSWVSLREQEATHTVPLSNVPQQKAAVSYRWVTFLPCCPGHPGFSCPHIHTSYHHTLSFKSPRFVHPSCSNIKS